MTDIPGRLGFHEVGQLADARAKVLEAIRSANLADYRAAWRHYQSLVEAHNKSLPTTLKWKVIRTIPARLVMARTAIRWAGFTHLRSAWRCYSEARRALPQDNPYAKAQIGSRFSKAAIWRAAHDRVRYWRELHEAATYAHYMGYGDIAVLANHALDRAARSRSFFAEYCQAIGRYDDAIEEYIEREQDECLPTGSAESSVCDWQSATWNSWRALMRVSRPT
jgi:hypothetical protein